MTAKNLSIVFAPNVLRARTPSYDTLVNDARRVVSCFHFVLANHKHVIPEFGFKGASDGNGT